jgi:SAM-dependent methyltransferase
MISASERSWNSATTLYIARKLEQLANGRRLAVLDAGCGDGTVLQHLLNYEHECYGYDLELRYEGLRERLGPHFKNEFENRLRLAPDERTIPFADASFDVVYANQVFEHVRFLDRLMSEIARVLRPGGVLISLFPLATYPIELHSKIPFAHWLPPGALRISYLRMFYTLRLRPCERGMSAHETAVYWDTILREFCYYRFMNEIQALSDWYFESMELDTGSYIRAKTDLLNSSGKRFQRMKGEVLGWMDGPAFEFLITHAFGAVFVMKNPKRFQSAGSTLQPNHLAAQMYRNALNPTLTVI